MRIFSLALCCLLAANAARAEDWTGLYAGLGLNRADGEQDTGSGIFPLEGSPVALFAGYNWQSGNLVLGGELALHADDMTLVDFPAIAYNKLIDLKARIGYASGRTLVYGVVGKSRAEYVNGPFVDDLDGYSFGIGADLRLADRVFGGIEYLNRTLDHLNPGVSTNVNTVTLRVGMTF